MGYNSRTPDEHDEDFQSIDVSDEGEELPENVQPDEDSYDDD